MQLNKRTTARGYFERYIQAAEVSGPLPAYHNLPDSFLLQRGMSKMTDPECGGGAAVRLVRGRGSAVPLAWPREFGETSPDAGAAPRRGTLRRRVNRWKHRAHSPRALTHIHHRDVPQ